MPFLRANGSSRCFGTSKCFFMYIYILGWAALKTYNSIKWAIQSTYKHIGATWLTIARSPKPTKSIRSEAKLWTANIFDTLHWIEATMEIGDSHWNKSYLFGFVKWGWPTLQYDRLNAFLFIQYSSQKKTVSSMRQPTKHDRLFHLFSFAFSSASTEPVRHNYRLCISKIVYF